MTDRLDGAHDPIAVSRVLERDARRREIRQWLIEQAIDTSGESAWVAARTNRRADRVAGTLRACGLTVVCPMIRAWRKHRNSRCRVPVNRPLFERYLFIRLALRSPGRIFEAAAAGVLTWPEVDCLLGDRVAPLPLSEAAVRRLAGYTDEEPLPPDPLVSIGDRVKRRIGAFAAIEAVVSEIDQDRRTAKMEARLFGAMIPWRDVPLDDLERIT